MVTASKTKLTHVVILFSRFLCYFWAKGNLIVEGEKEDEIYIIIFASSRESRKERIWYLYYRSKDERPTLIDILLYKKHEREREREREWEREIQSGGNLSNFLVTEI